LGTSLRWSTAAVCHQMCGSTFSSILIGLRRQLLHELERSWDGRRWQQRETIPFRGLWWGGWVAAWNERGAIDKGVNLYWWVLVYARLRIHDYDICRSKKMLNCF
jgi:hypothetical protein